MVQRLVFVRYAYHNCLQYPKHIRNAYHIHAKCEVSPSMQAAVLELISHRAARRRPSQPGRPHQTRAWCEASRSVEPARPEICHKSLAFVGDPRRSEDAGPAKRDHSAPAFLGHRRLQPARGLGGASPMTASGWNNGAATSVGRRRRTNGAARPRSRRRGATNHAIDHEPARVHAEADSAGAAAEAALDCVA